MKSFVKVVLYSLVVAFFIVFPQRANAYITDCYEDSVDITPPTAEDPTTTISGKEDACIGEIGDTIEVQLTDTTTGAVVFTQRVVTIDGDSGFLSFEPAVFTDLPPDNYNVVLRYNDGADAVVVDNFTVTSNLDLCGQFADEFTTCPKECLETENSFGQPYCGCGNDGQPPCTADSLSDFIGCADNYVISEDYKSCIHRNLAPANPLIGKCPDLSDGVNTALGCFNFLSPIKFYVSIVRFLLGAGGGITLILIAYASFRIQTSQGDPKTLQGAKDLLTSAVAGLLMFVLSAFLLSVIGVDILGLFS